MTSKGEKFLALLENSALYYETLAAQREKEGLTEAAGLYASVGKVQRALADKARKIDGK